MKKRNIIFIALCLLCYIVISCYRLDLPGFQYDEVLFGNAARLGKADSSFIYLRLFGIPLLLMEYIGALKSYLYIPIFYMFGFNYMSVRLPMVILSVISLLVLYRSVSRSFSSKVAMGVVLLLSVDPAFITHTRTDVGPNAIAFFLGVLSLGFAFDYIKSKHKLDLFLLALTLFLGCYNKQNHIWFTLSILSGIVVLNHKKMVMEIMTYVNKQKNILAVFILLTGCIPVLIFINRSSLPKLFTLDIKHTLLVIREFFMLFSGQEMYQLFFGKIISVWLFIIPFFIVTVSCIYIFSNWNKKTKQTKLLIWIIVFIFLQIVITKAARSSWHLFSLYPFVHIIFVVSLFSLFRNKWFYVVSTGVAASIYVTINIIYINSYNISSVNHEWSKAIDSLMSYTKQSSKQFISIDWGTHNQILNNDYQKNKYTEGWVTVFKSQNDENKNLIVADWFARKNTQWIFMGPKYARFPRNKIKVFQLAQSLNKQYVLKYNFYDGKRLMYQIFEFH